MCAVTFQCRIRRVPTFRTTKTENARNIAVTATKTSHTHTALT